MAQIEISMANFFNENIYYYREIGSFASNYWRSPGQDDIERAWHFIDK